MLTVQHIMESISRAYIQAIAGVAGLNLSIRINEREFDYGMDGTFHSITIRNRRRVEAGFPLDFQLKASKNWSCNNKFIYYDLEVKTFNDLVNRNSINGAVPSILILLCLPPNIDEWVETDEDKLLLRKCCYWKLIKGKQTRNNKTIRVTISRKQRLTSESLVELIDKVKLGALK